MTDLLSDPNYDYLLGIRADLKWRDLQPTRPNEYDWSYMQTILQDAYARNKIAQFSIEVGPDSPTWIYSNGVPAVETDDEKHEGMVAFPYYPSEAYKKYFFEVIKQFGIFLRTQPKYLLERIAYVQVMTGCTGDEVPYKGNPKNHSYDISGDQWTAFRIETFDQFRVSFNEGVNPKIPLLFNGLDEVKNRIVLNWIMKYMTFGFGIKGSAYVRGHHLSDELSFRTYWTRYLINAKEKQIFSSAEMDQTWKNALYQINVPLGFYWGAINGLNTGLSVWTVSKDALFAAKKYPELHDIFRFFNRHAGQIYPSTANAAFVIFHEGLNSENTTKFPESIYGKAQKINQDRYTAICKAYSDKGAKMSDIYSATQGQVYQRESQTGFNDAGWDIEENNYGRWITQLNPDGTSIGLFRVRGPINVNSSKYDRFARSFQSSTARNAMYFKFHEELFSTNAPNSLTFKITWLDKNPRSEWAFKYYNSIGVKTALKVIGVGDNQWKSVNATINDAVVNKQGPMGSDFILENTDAIDDIFHGIEVWITRK